MPRAMREVAALDRQILAHLEIHRATGLERAVAARLGGGAGPVFDRMARLLRRRYPLFALGGAVTAGGGGGGGGGGGAAALLGAGASRRGSVGRLGNAGSGGGRCGRSGGGSAIEIIVTGLAGWCANPAR